MHVSFHELDEIGSIGISVFLRDNKTSSNKILGSSWNSLGFDQK